MIINAVEGKPLPVYGDGLNIRDWLYVTDHCAAIRLVLERGRSGETYNIGGDNERTNLDVIRAIGTILDALKPRPGNISHAGLIAFVKDRPGHDRRYAMDSRKIRRELEWRPHESFNSALENTVRWYLDNNAWMDKVMSGEYRNWVATHYAQQERA